MLKYAPAVFAVHDQYMIMIRTEENCFFSLQIGEHAFCDAVNGIVRSGSLIHTLYVPKALLDRTGHYEITLTHVPHREAYYNAPGESCTYAYDFTPVPEKDARAFFLADTHWFWEAPINACKAYGPIDFLMLGGDVLCECELDTDWDRVLILTDALTKGRIPTVFIRGNHDMRGTSAERLDGFMPKAQNRTYYTVRLGDIWALVLDCGEDKLDSCIEYGGTVCCHPFRMEQTAFIQDVIARADSEYLAPGVRHKWVLCHHPFSIRQPVPFDIEQDTYTQWGQLLRDHVQPEAMLCGHTHFLCASPMHSPDDSLGQCAPLLTGSAHRDDYQAGVGLHFTPEGTTATFIDSDGVIIHETPVTQRMSYWTNRKHQL